MRSRPHAASRAATERARSPRAASGRSAAAATVSAAARAARVRTRRAACCLHSHSVSSAAELDPGSRWGWQPATAMAEGCPLCLLSHQGPRAWKAPASHRGWPHRVAHGAAAGVPLAAAVLLLGWADGRPAQPQPRAAPLATRSCSSQNRPASKSAVIGRADLGPRPAAAVPAPAHALHRLRGRAMRTAAEPAVAAPVETAAPPAAAATVPAQRLLGAWSRWSLRAPAAKRLGS
mmetsp:Transcript_91425/g.254608  ORF Transcript_91425/g.254608 Transcript_91425/m.254608 type:complete len:234 (+) Transcript_91425:533-1234(+)